MSTDNERSVVTSPTQNGQTRLAENLHAVSGFLLPNIFVGLPIENAHVADFSHDLNLSLQQWVIGCFMAQHLKVISASIAMLHWVWMGWP